MSIDKRASVNSNLLIIFRCRTTVSICLSVFLSVCLCVCLSAIYQSIYLGMPKSSEVPPEEYMLEENEERSMIEPKSYENPKLKDLIKIIVEWINDELVEERIIIQERQPFFFFIIIFKREPCIHIILKKCNRSLYIFFSPFTVYCQWVLYLINYFLIYVYIF